MLATVLTIVLIVTSVGAIVGSVLWWRARATGDVRRVVRTLRELLQEAVAVGGLDKPRFLADESRRAEQELADLCGRVNDRRLRTACEETLACYRRTLAAAPPERGARVVVAGMPESPEWVEREKVRTGQLQREVTNATETLEQIGRVLERINALERFVPRRD